MHISNSKKRNEKSKNDKKDRDFELLEEKSI